MTIISRGHNFASLSVKDLLDAREAYHVHLVHLENVVATAIGRYRFTRGHEDRAVDERGTDEPRTLANSVVVPKSWPSILVFVNKWIPVRDFAKKVDEIVPPRLYLPDGRVVPTCVIYAEQEPLLNRPVDQIRFPGTTLGGGFPVLSEVQGSIHVGTIGCLASDGRSLFALTNLHVAGEPGSASFVIVQGQREQIGTSDHRQVAKLKLGMAYPGFPDKHTTDNLDAGLIRLEDASRWTSQVYGIGEFGELADLNPDTATLDLVGCPTVAYGAASGLMKGEIHALFYRYRSLGGMDYVSDLLIGPQSGASQEEAAQQCERLSRHGNSGAIWFLEQPHDQGVKRRPIALHWGAQRFGDGSGDVSSQFALASSLGTICRELDVEIVRDMNAGLPDTWGKTGHYKIGQVACALVSHPDLRRLMEANVDRVAFSDHDLMDLGNALSRRKFIPLSDVPDLVWKVAESKRGREGPNHFADMDRVSPKLKKSLLELTTSKKHLAPETWDEFYVSIGAKVQERGLLPFRVWQLFDVMQDALISKDIDTFLCAAGVLSHYIADACQPLHISMWHDGDPESGDGKGVHSAYETKMVDRFAPDLIELVNSKLPEEVGVNSIQDGHDAGFATVKLMRRTVQRLKPQKIVETFANNRGRGQIAALWNEFGDATAETMVEGAKLLAQVWDAAWAAAEASSGEPVPKDELIPRNLNTLRAIYMDRDFAPSVYLTMMTLENERLVVTQDG